MDPCSSNTVTGRVVSLYRDHTHVSNLTECRCRVDGDTTSNNIDNILFTAYDIQTSSNSNWNVAVSDMDGNFTRRYSNQDVFPAKSETTPSSSLPLFVVLSVDDPAAGPQRVWLGVQCRWFVVEAGLNPVVVVLFLWSVDFVSYRLRCLCCCHPCCLIVKLYV